MKVRDNTYKVLSSVAYSNNPGKSRTIIYKDRKEKWQIISGNKKFKLHDPDTGFDAMVAKHKDTVVIAYRGTEMNSAKNAVTVGIKDGITDFNYIVRNRPVKELDLHVELEKGKFHVDFYKQNQFRQADELAQEVQKAYPKAKVSLTGHSLAGSMASYAAAKNDLHAVTFNGPSVIGLLPKDLKEKAEKGGFDKQIVNYVHPKDSISSGAINPYKRYIGSAYYIGSSFELENSKNRYNPVSRAWGSLAGAGYHGMQHYKFDEFGNVSNPTLTNVLTGESLATSPRFASADSGTIKVTPVDLKELASELESFVGKVESICNSFKQKASVLDDIQTTEDVLNDVLQRVHHVSGWFAQDTARMVSNLNAAAESFVEADHIK
ncbi:lipase family protein [Priestia megaterium]|uniref:lipase family protein n=1 Tax=Priestia megaterium TaxID=1404 RepID=UPI000CA1D7FB|nr:hypothetical protein [Priestia megaterium]AUO14174.1 hypothetical protein C0569_23665 [Priestia megaterium]RMA95682.1 lipase (class 3) [Priestia megaterium]